VNIQEVFKRSRRNSLLCYTDISYLVSQLLLLLGQRYVQLNTELFLCLIKRQAMEAQGGSGDIAPHIFINCLRRRWVVRLTCRPLYFGKSALVTVVQEFEWFPGKTDEKLLSQILRRAVPVPPLRTHNYVTKHVSVVSVLVV